MMHGLIDVDVTRARALLRDYRAQTGESLSFTAFIISCLGRAVDENRAVQAFRKGSRRLVVFEDVDVYTLIERDVAGQKQPIPYIVRETNRKTLRGAARRDPGSAGPGRRPSSEVASVRA